MLSALYAIARTSVRLSVRLSVTRVDQSKTVQVRIMQFSPQSSPVTIVFAWYGDKFHREIPTGFPWAGRQTYQTRMGWGKQAFMRRYLQNGTRYVQSYY